MASATKTSGIQGLMVMVAVALGYAAGTTEQVLYLVGLLVVGGAAAWLVSRNFATWLLAPLSGLTEACRRMVGGDASTQMDAVDIEEYRPLTSAIEELRRSLQGVAEGMEICQGLAVNNLNRRVEGKYPGIGGELASAVNATRDRLINIQNIIGHIATGDFRDLEMLRDIGQRSQDDHMVPSFIAMMETILGMTQEIQALGDAIRDGQLDMRIDAARYQGAYIGLVEAVDEALDALISPLKMNADYVDRISKGDIPDVITDHYRGDFDKIKNNLNTCISAVNHLIEDVGMLAQAAIEGRLQVRADSSRHQGEFRRIVEGVNATLDSVVYPVNEVSRVLDEMEKGNLGIRVVGSYQGDHAIIKNALNVTLDRLKSYVGEISKVLNQMANRDLDVSVSGDYLGDFQEIKDSLNLIIDSMNEMLSEFNSAADQVAAGADQIAGSGQSLAQGATEQASTIQQLNASIGGVAAQTHQNAENANQANQLALNARDNAVEGNGQMEAMLNAMEEINEASANISRIIKVIDEIAFQTNILALNAAVEAARAGQHGKGFAVVAEEVRNLAARSASAAKETTDMIEGSVKKVAAGTKIASETAQALSSIVESVSQVAGLVANIAAASNEQAEAISQVNAGIEQVAHVVQMNAANAQESAAASEELSSQAELLKNNVGTFRLKKNTDLMGRNQMSTDIFRMLENMMVRERGREMDLPEPINPALS